MKKFGKSDPLLNERNNWVFDFQIKNRNFDNSVK